MNSLQEIAEKYEKEMKAVAFPNQPARPARAGFANNASFGQAVDDWEEAMIEFRSLKAIYRQEQARLMECFCNEAMAHLGVSNHPKALTLWRIAYERGHSSGLHEIATELEELSELLV